MSFDVFGDFETRGHLRNFEAEKNLDIIKQAEHRAFQKNLGPALDYLFSQKTIAYADVLETHKILFSSIYPWAGQDRLTTAPYINISKGGYDRMFAFPKDIRRVTDYALHQGNDVKFMQDKPGEVLGSLAHAHPFFDGNGRTIMVVHTIMADRAGISIDWQNSEKQAYLEALTKEIHLPGDGHLDAYLKPLLRPAIDRSEAQAILNTMKALSPAEALATEPATDLQSQSHKQ